MSDQVPGRSVSMLVPDLIAHHSAENLSHLRQSHLRRFPKRIHRLTHLLQEATSRVGSLLLCGRLRQGEGALRQGRRVNLNVPLAVLVALEDAGCVRGEGPAFQCATGVVTMAHSARLVTLSEVILSPSITNQRSDDHDALSSLFLDHAAHPAATSVPVVQDFADLDIGPEVLGLIGEGSTRPCPCHLALDVLDQEVLLHPGMIGVKSLSMNLDGLIDGHGTDSASASLDLGDLEQDVSVHDGVAKGVTDLDGRASAHGVLLQVDGLSVSSSTIANGSDNAMLKAAERRPIEGDSDESRVTSMCRSCADGGRRCSRANPTRSWRTSVMERRARNLRVSGQVEGPRQQELTALVERDDALLSQIEEAVQRYGETVTHHEIQMPQDVHDFVEGMREQGLRPVLVGGSVRDSFDGREPKDLDFEMYPETPGQRLTPDDVSAAASRFGRVDEVGKAFGVLKMTLPSGTDLDLSVPRRENKVGVGHKGFKVEVDSSLTVSEAAERRDFTVNAISHDPHLEVLIDPHGGVNDLRAGTLRHVSDAFDEDPLRVLRGVQFAARYEMEMDPETARRCRGLRGEAGDLAVERTRAEWEKWSTKGRSPSSGLKVLAQTGWDEVTPGMAGRASDPEVHRQVDAMRSLLDSEQGRGVDARVGLGAVLAREMSDDDARAFLGQSIEGARAQRHAFSLSRADAPPLEPAEARSQARSELSTLRERALLHQSLRTPGAEAGYQVAMEAEVEDGPEQDWASGRDVLSIAGRQPGPWVGDVLKEYRQAQDAREFPDREGGLLWLRDRLAT